MKTVDVNIPFLNFIVMKRMFVITFLLALVSSASFAQKMVTEICPICGGLGGFYVAYTFSPCYYCMSKGYITKQDPQEVMQAAADYGACLMIVSLGKDAIINGNYDDAWKKLKEAMSEYDSAEAYLYLGAMIELGMGVESKKDLAFKCYKYAADLGNSDAKAALQRIKSSGYWSATEEKRLQFRQALSIQMGVSMTPVNSGGGIYQGGNSGVNSSESYSNGRSCAGCSGTGKCTMCNGKGGYWLDTGMYTGEDIKNWKTCTACHGSGQCQVCFGKGFIRY